MGYGAEPVYSGPAKVWPSASGAKGAPSPPGVGPGGQVGGYSPQTYDPFAYDNAIAAAMMVESPGADQTQAGQADQSASLTRMASPPAADMSAQTDSEVWVTVPVDKVEVRRGKGTVTPVYATAQGYQSPAQGNLIPPVPAAGRQQ